MNNFGTLVRFEFKKILTRKSVYIALAICIFLVIIISMLNFPFAEKARYFFPVSMGAFWDIITQYSFSVLGLDFWLYEAVCIVAFGGIGLSLMLTYCNFYRHQVQ